MKVSDARIGFVGFGHMAQIICGRILSAKLIPPSHLSFIRRDPSKMRESEKQFGITSTSLKTLVEMSDLILICVRPAQAEAVLPELARLGGAAKMIVSVLAGVKLSYYQKHFGKQAQILRAMPNLASSVGEGMSIFSYAPHASIEFKSLSHALFSCMGNILEVAEDLLDISTAIAGSGPGFVFSLVDAFARAGEKFGLSYEKALQMAAQTFLGAAKVIQKEGSIEKLIQQIATPNGTTEAGLKVFRTNEIDKHLMSVIAASRARSQEISEEFL